VLAVEYLALGTLGIMGTHNAHNSTCAQPFHLCGPVHYVFGRCAFRNFLSSGSVEIRGTHRAALPTQGRRRGLMSGAQCGSLCGPLGGGYHRKPLVGLRTLKSRMPLRAWREFLQIGEVSHEAKKKAKRKAPTNKKTRFRREDIPGINPALDDIADPFEVARILGVHISELKARPMKLHGVGPRGGALVNDFYTKEFLGFLFSPQAFLAFQRHQPR
jgi:hypothetical protein